MSRETENFFRYIQAFMDQNNDEFESPEEAISHFTSLYDEGLIDDLEDDTSRALDLMEEALESDDPHERLTLLKEAYRLAPDNLDIYCMLCLEQYEEIEAIPLIEAQVAQFFKTNRQSIKESGYLDLENRPYFRAQKLLLDYYKQEWLLGTAEMKAKEILRYNQNDNLGARYTLIAVYVLSSQYKKARSFYKKEAGHQGDEQLLLYLATSLILEGDLDYAAKIIGKLAELNPHIYQFFLEDEFNNIRVEGFAQMPYYQLNSPASLASALHEILILFIMSQYLYQAFRGILERINPEIFEHIQIEKEVRASAFHDAPLLAGTGIFKNIAIQYVRQLLLEGLRTIEDFQTKEEWEILAIEGIGKSTVKKLRENGVTFKGE